MKVEIVRILPYFQVGDDGQEDPIEVEVRRLEKRSRLSKSVAVNRAIDCTQGAINIKIQRRPMCSVSPVDRLALQSTGARACRLLETRIKFRFHFIGDFKFLFWWTSNRAQFIFYKRFVSKV